MLCNFSLHNLSFHTLIKDLEDNYHKGNIRSRYFSPPLFTHPILHSDGRNGSLSSEAMPFLHKQREDIRAILTARPFCKREQMTGRSERTLTEEGVQQLLFSSRTWMFQGDPEGRKGWFYQANYRAPTTEQNPSSLYDFLSPFVSWHTYKGWLWSPSLPFVKAALFLHDS